MATITVSTDGSALGNPNGAMGWAWADHVGGGCDAGGAGNGTNQIGELCAVLQALRTHKGADTLVIESDSQYAIKCSTVWLRSWKRNGWHNSQKQPVKNATIIKAIDYEISHREGPVKFSWVKGHAGNEFNEKCDMLARGFAEQCKQHGSNGFLPIEGWKDLIASPYASRLKVPDDVMRVLEGGEATISQTIASTVYATSYGNRNAGAIDAAGSGNGNGNAPAGNAINSTISSTSGNTRHAAAAPQRQAPQRTASQRAASPNTTAQGTTPQRTAPQRHVVEPPLFPSDAPSTADQAELINRAARQLLDASKRLEQATERYEDAAAKLEAVIKRLDDATRNNMQQGTLF
ncbi:ribonuclease H family protein [Pseudoscardovia suis]|nr:ribonuclease H [Pseudoscardovia suis]